MNIDDAFDKYCKRFENNTGNESDLFEVMTEAFWMAYSIGKTAGKMGIDDSED